MFLNDSSWGDIYCLDVGMYFVVIIDVIYKLNYN